MSHAAADLVTSQLRKAFGGEPLDEGYEKAHWFDLELVVWAWKRTHKNTSCKEDQLKKMAELLREKSNFRELTEEKNRKNDRQMVKDLMAAVEEEKTIELAGHPLVKAEHQRDWLIQFSKQIFAISEPLHSVLVDAMCRVRRVKEGGKNATRFCKEEDFELPGDGKPVKVIEIVEEQANSKKDKAEDAKKGGAAAAGAGAPRG